MYEYFISNNTTNESFSIFGRSYENACIRWNINPSEYSVIYTEYVD